jgi:glutamate synthase domain-containing protein 2
MVIVLVLVAVVLLVAGVAVYDLVQRRHAVLRNFPVIGHLRYILESFGPETRQYLVTSNDDERPFSRDQRRWIYTSAKHLDNTFGFGTDNDIEHAQDYLIVKHAAFPLPLGRTHPSVDFAVPAAKMLGRARGRRLAFRPDSLVNISGMSFGSLSAAAIESINRGAQVAGCWQNTGEGGISPYHEHGADLVWQIGTGYFGCREADGTFSLDRLADAVAARPQVRAIELKLSQGAKPGIGGMLPGVKVTPEIAAIRGIPVGVDCKSPAHHSAFHDVDGLLDLVESIADRTGLPVGIKSAVGELGFWHDLADRTATTGRSVDFVTIDGGEGGTGAGPLVFTDHVALPFRFAFTRVYRLFAERGLHDDIVWIGSGKLGLPENALFALALGCDQVSVGREVLMATGCIQSQRCHTGGCPTGVATQSRWLQHGLDPDRKHQHVANYVAALRFELVRLGRACGQEHPALVTAAQLELLESHYASAPLDELFGYEPGWGLPPAADRDELRAAMAEVTPEVSVPAPRRPAP